LVQFGRLVGPQSEHTFDFATEEFIEVYVIFLSHAKRRKYQNSPLNTAKNNFDSVIMAAGIAWKYI
jgi:hypothetical protein